MNRKQLKRHLLRLGLVVMVLILAGAALSCSSSSPSSPPPEIGKPAPDFTLSTMEGTEITLSELQGTPVLLNFWDIGCPPCRVELPYFDVVARQYPDKVTVLTINIKDSLSQLQQFFGDSEIDFIVALDKSGQVSSNYVIRYTPTTFFIDSQGILRDIKVGAFANEIELMTSVGKLLK